MNSTFIIELRPFLHIFCTHKIYVQANKKLIVTYLRKKKRAPFPPFCSLITFYHVILSFVSDNRFMYYAQKKFRVKPLEKGHPTRKINILRVHSRTFRSLCHIASTSNATWKCHITRILY